MPIMSATPGTVKYHDDDDDSDEEEEDELQFTLKQRPGVLPDHLKTLFKEWTKKPSEVEHQLWDWIDRAKTRHALDTPSLFTRYDVNELRERAFYLSKETKSERDALEAIACALVARSKESGRRGSLTHQRRHTNTHGKGDWEETVPNFLTLAEVMKNLGEFNAAAYYYISASKETLSDTQGNPELVNLQNWCATQCNDKLRLPDAAIKVYETELNFLKRIGDSSKDKAKCYAKVGTCYQHLGQDEQAYKSFKMMTDLMERELPHNDTQFLKALVVLGNMANKIGMTEAALQYHRRAHDTLQQENDSPERNHLLANVDLKIGSTLLDMHCPHDARWFLSSAVTNFDPAYRERLHDARTLLKKCDDSLGVEQEMFGNVSSASEPLSQFSTSFSDNVTDAQPRRKAEEMDGKAADEKASRKYRRLSPEEGRRSVKSDSTETETDESTSEDELYGGSGPRMLGFPSENPAPEQNDPFNAPPGSSNEAIGSNDSPMQAESGSQPNTPGAGKPVGSSGPLGSGGKGTGSMGPLQKAGSSGPFKQGGGSRGPLQNTAGTGSSGPLSSLQAGKEQQGYSASKLGRTGGGGSAGPLSPSSTSVPQQIPPRIAERAGLIPSSPRSALSPSGPINSMTTLPSFDKYGTTPSTRNLTVQSQGFSIPPQGSPRTKAGSTNERLSQENGDDGEVIDPQQRNALNWAADALAWSPEHAREVRRRVSQSFSRGGTEDAVKATEPQQVPYGFSSNLSDFGLTADGNIQSGYESFGEAARELQSHVNNLSMTLEALAAASGTRRYSRVQGDGTVATDDSGAEAIEGREEEAERLAQETQDAAKSLIASYNVHPKMDKEDPDEQAHQSAEWAQLKKMQNRLLPQLLNASESVENVLKVRGIRSADLKALIDSAKGDDDSADSSTEEDNRVMDGDSYYYRKVRNLVRRQHEQVSPTEEGSSSSSQGTGRFQPGLHKAIPNPEGRRLKAVAMTASDIFDAVKYRIMALGAFKSLGNRRRQGRVAFKTFSVGLLVKFGRMRRMQRYSAEMFTVGFMMGCSRRMKIERRKSKLFALGLVKTELRRHNRAVYSAKLFSMGVMVQLRKERLLFRYSIRLFAAGVFPMLLRVQGNPTGYSKKKKGKGKAAKSTLRQFHYDKVQNTEGTIWEGANPNTNYAVAKLFPDLFDMFDQKKKAKQTKIASKKKEKKKELVRFIDESQNRRQNMGIAISKFKKFGYQNLADRLIRMSIDDIPDGVDSIQKLLGDVAPKPEELELAQKYETTANMDEPEKFVWHMSKVPKLKARLKCLEVIATWEDKRTKLEETINTVNNACNEILNSKRMRKFLVDYVLPFSNALNAGTTNKVPGIKVSGILKLNETKAVKDPKVTMLDYLIDRVGEHEPEVLELDKDFKALQWALNINEDKIQTQWNELRKDHDCLQTHVENAKQVEQGRDSDFLTATEEEFAKITDEVDTIKERKTEMEDKYSKACQYLAEDKTTKKEDLFSLVRDVIKTFRQAVEKYNTRKEEQEKRRKKEEAAHKKKQGKPKAPKPKQPKPWKSPVGREPAQSG